MRSTEHQIQFDTAEWDKKVSCMSGNDAKIELMCIVRQLGELIMSRSDGTIAGGVAYAMGILDVLFTDEIRKQLYHETH